jgi:ADP-ribose pyrophosphatase
MRAGFARETEMSDEQSSPTIEQSDHLYEGPIFKLRRDKFRSSSEENLTTRDVVEHPGAVGLLAITDDRHLLLIQQYRHPAGQSLLELPAGLIDPGESAIETGLRELTEETGYEAGQSQEVLRFFSSPGYSTEQITLVLARDCRLASSPTGEEEGLKLVSWPIDELGRLLERGIQDAKTLVGILWLQANPP